MNSAAPNTRYTYGNYTYETDEVARLASIEGAATLKDHRRFVTSGEPNTVAIGNEGVFEDVGFHAIGNQFDGPINRLNVFPGSGRSITLSDGEVLKNLNLSRYKVDFENPVAKLIRETGQPVPIRFETIYNKSNMTSRPDAFKASYQQADGNWREVLFRNKAGG
ncbi:DNA/RNA non-specific endonuclease [Massilia violaceinigra]|uniref:DNA/RNA non-specific endonuclease n=1 Tax=Massilia violaceinigra TaxID=2045208 RepID=A0ABY4A5B0_9BURK|nr:DNA/RNA non-specific endonuclease [Massilia violaceinigra]UOD29976.1 DNA/RNA non-specific endonuclease [Massilia violaceinigra]